MSTPAPGTLIGGYRLEAVAGRGGMGVIYRATQLALDRQVALKLIAPELSEDADFRERFKRESRIAARIQHPNVIPVHEAGEADGRLFIAMRFIDGHDLSTLIATSERLDARRAAGIVAQVASALDAAHSHGIVHRDVKPGNVLIASEGGADHAYLTDFGLTKQLDSTTAFTQTGMWVGTVDYVAPEQITGAPVDARADVYAIGCMLFHSLAGQVPFPRERPEAKIYAHAHEPPPLLSEFYPELPQALTGVLQRAMAKDPDERYPSAGDFARAVGAALEGRAASTPEHSVATGAAAPTRAPSTRPAARRAAGGRVRRRRFPVAIGVVAIVAIGAVVLVAAGVLGGDGADSPDTDVTRIPAGSDVAALNADRGRVVMERAGPGGRSLLSRLDGEEVDDLEVTRVDNYTGIDVGLDEGGKPIVVYARCDPPDQPTCDIWRSDFSGGNAQAVVPAARQACLEVGPNISLGTLVYRVRHGTGCAVGLFAKQLGEPAQPPQQLTVANEEIGDETDLDGEFLAWETNDERTPLRVARLAGAQVGTPIDITPPTGHDFQGSSLVLDDGYLYFIDVLQRGPSYSIARTSVERGSTEFAHYPKTFDSAPPFAITGRDLFYVEGEKVIVRHEGAEFEPGLAR